MDICCKSILKIYMKQNEANIVRGSETDTIRAFLIPMPIRTMTITNMIPSKRFKIKSSRASFTSSGWNVILSISKSAEALFFV